MRRFAGVLVGTGILIWLGVQPLWSADRWEITILHTSDLHGQVLPRDDAGDRQARGSLARVAVAVNAIRSTTDHPVLLLDSGDTIQGTPLEEYVHVKWGEPSPTIEAMNVIGYEAMAVGNHEFNFGLDPLRRAEAEANFPFLGANIVDSETGEPAFTPSIVKEIDGLKIGILGLITSNVPGWEKPAHYRGLAFEPMDESARKWVPRLRQDEGCDLVVVLAHTGFEVDPETGEAGETAYENFGDRLTEVPGIDVLMTGHAHDDIGPTKLRGAIVSQPSARGRMLTRLDLEIARDASGKAEIVAWSGENLDLGETDVDAALVERFRERHARVVEELAAPLTEATAAVSVRRCRLEDCAAVDLLHQVQLDASEADLSLAGLLSTRTVDLEPGPVTRRWVRSLYVYANTLEVVRVTGAQVKDILEYAARYYTGIRCPDEGPCAVLVNPEIRHYNIDSMQGLQYRIDPTAPEGDRIRDLRRNGEPLDLHAEFTLVCNNYRAAGGGGYPHLAEAPVIWRSTDSMTTMIDHYLGALDRWNPSADGNWCIAPKVAREVRFETASQ